MIRTLIGPIILALLVASTAKAETPTAEPTVAVGDPKSLDSIFTFGPEVTKPSAFAKSSIGSRIDITPPPGTTITRAAMPENYQGVVNIELSDGRCYDFSRGALVAAACHTYPVRPVTAQPPVPGAKYIGRLWGNYFVWEDPATHRTMLVHSQRAGAIPWVTTTMKVLSAGNGLGSPDVAALNVTLAGFVDKQFSIVTLYLVYGSQNGPSPPGKASHP